jgi:hypothetical protein
MTRTPLLQGLRRADQLAKFANERQISPETARRIWDVRINRRRLFQGSLAAAGALCALGLDRQDRQQVDAAIAPVLIVGAGIAGLTAAY